ncbi:MAG TPA: hypothetical protein VFF52_00355 [Isosphaeraceae bacterium]|nr:hypothetical protein [Isosphaeraceae bacterium]
MNSIARRRRPGGLRSRLDILVYGLLLAAGPTGCDGRNDEGTSPGYLPGWAEARQALESALAAWRDAPSPLPASFDSPAVTFVDRRRRPGQRLLSFEVLGWSEVENARQFTVRLRLENEVEPRLVRYNVLGRNPVWVFRLEDYEAISHWEMDMSRPPSDTDRGSN